VLTKDKANLKTHVEEFDLNSDFLTSLYSLIENLEMEDALKDINNFYKFIDTDFESHWIQTYHEELGSYSVKNLTKLLYCLAYIERLDYDELKNSISNKVTKTEQDLESKRTGIVEQLEGLRNVLNENEAMSSYPEKLSKLKTGITYIKNLIDNNNSYSCLLIVNSLLEQLDNVLDNADAFCSQLEDIYTKIEAQKKRVDNIQESIDEIYSGSLAEKLISFEYQTKRNNEYLWKRTYLKENLKQSDEYEHIFENKTFYNPFTRSTIIEDKISKFALYIEGLSKRLLPTFNETLNKLKEKQEKANKVEELNNYISELLNTEDDD
jgi:flagellin-like hook-associated protein FlgL